MSDLIPTAARFNARVADYARYRPTYPSAVIDALFQGLGDPHDLVVVDIGAGTGISSRLLADRGARVIALEPNPEMRAAIGDERIEAHHATADRTGVPDASADLVTAFQAFHWFADVTTAREFARILRPGGRVGLVWNIRDEDDAFTLAYADVAEAHERSASMSGEEDYETLLPKLFGAAGFTAMRRRTFKFSQRLEVEALLGRARSSSYVPREGPAHDQIMSGLRALHAEHAAADGTVALAYNTIAFLAETPQVTLS